MTIDKFGRSLKSHNKEVKGPKGEGFNLTPDGDYDMQNKKLRNVGVPVNIGDAATKRFVEQLSLKRTAENDYDVENKKICNLGIPTKAHDAATKSYVDYRAIPYTPDGYIFRNKKVTSVADATDITDAVNLGTLNRLCITVNNNNYDARDKQITNLAKPFNPNDAATKAYVDTTCQNNIVPVSTNLAKQLININNIDTRLAKCEGQIISNKDYHDKNLRKFGTIIYNYINRKQTGRASIIPTLGENDYLNWEEIFKLPDINEDDEEINAPDVGPNRWVS